MYNFEMHLMIEFRETAINAKGIENPKPKTREIETNWIVIQSPSI